MSTNHFADILSSVGWPNSNSNDPVGLVGLTGCDSGHGVSTLAGQVAATAAAFQKQVLIVDCDFDHPTQHRIFNRRQSTGLADLVSSDEDLTQRIQETSVPNLRLLAAGSSKTQLSWNEDTLRAVFRTVLAEYDLVICDIPVLGSQPHCETALALMDRVLMVVDSKKITSMQLANLRRRMDRRGIPLAGIVMNRSRSGNSGS